MLFLKTYNTVLLLNEHLRPASLKIMENAVIGPPVYDFPFDHW